MSDQEAAEKNANVERIGLNELGQPTYRSDNLHDLNNRDIRIDAFLAGLAHRDKQIEGLVKAGESLMDDLKEWINEAIECDHSVGICGCGTRLNLEFFEQALSQFESGK